MKYRTQYNERENAELCTHSTVVLTNQSLCYSLSSTVIAKATVPIVVGGEERTSTELAAVQHLH
jgi:hypothetical protein